MTVAITTNPFTNAIPTIEYIIKRSSEPKIHPDILLEIPVNMELFSKKFITMCRSQYENTGISSIENNCISFTLFEKSISLKKRLYCDHDKSKYYIAFDVYKLSESEIDSIDNVIKILTNNIVYLNRKGRKLPNFKNLFDVYFLINLFENYSEQDKIYYWQKI
jgi:hypothetical protein